MNDGIKALRWRQMKNFHLALMVSQGTPMVLMGDEYGHTRHGNNNTYGHDNELNNFDWAALEKQRDHYFRYHAGLVKFRKSHPLLGRAEFLNDNDITWHEDNWDNPDSLFLAYQLHDCGQGGGDLYIAFNQHDFFRRRRAAAPARGQILAQGGGHEPAASRGLCGTRRGRRRRQVQRRSEGRGHASGQVRGEDY